jgi:ABC-type lipoprotein export system ATPase subunit
LQHFRDRIVIVVTHDPVVMSQMRNTLFLQAHSAAGISSDHKRSDQRNEDLSIIWPESVDGAAAK